MQPGMLTEEEVTFFGNSVNSGGQTRSQLSALKEILLLLPKIPGGICLELEEILGILQTKNIFGKFRARTI